MSKKEKMNEEAINEEVIEEAAQTAEEVEQAEEMIDDQAVVIAELNKKVEEMEDKYLRAHAEMQNVAMRNRTEREQLQRYRSQDLAKKILPALDNLERAMAIEADDEVSTNLKKGVEMVAESLRQALNEEGVEEIAAIGETFDPILHQAVQTIPADDEHPADTIVEVFQKGYKLQDRVLRASMVVVAQ